LESDNNHTDDVYIRKSGKKQRNRLTKLTELVKLKLMILVTEGEIVMKMTTHGHLHQLAFMPRLFPVNCYLVEEEDGLTLIDCAMPFSAKGILIAALKLRKPIRRIVLTHAHGDHVGALDRLKRELPEAEVMISARDARLLAGDTSLQADEPQFPIRGDVPKKIATRPDRLLQDGDRIGSLTVHAVPGHTPGMLAFLDTRSGALIAGDALQTRGGVAVAGTLMPWFPFPAMATWHKPSAIESARKLLELKPSLLAVGHGNLLVNPQAAMQRAVERAEQEEGITRGKEGNLHA
jgi:glyoxylase-like metal-dependent hydrolase (beta-lactamase superfamily II)